MITKIDLQEAIAECLGQRNPTVNTCLKLAAFYTIMSNLYPDEQQPQPETRGYSFAAADALPAEEITYASGTEFSKAISGKHPGELWGIVDELMTTLSVVNPRLYNGVMRRIKER